MAGVIPPIFASAIILFPATIASWSSGSNGGMIQNIALSLSPGQPLYIMLYALAIIFFCYFYTAIVFNPDDTADNLKKQGGFIPGIRPGERTAQYIDFVLTSLKMTDFSLKENDVVEIEIEEIGNHRGHNRLLQHDLGQPNMVGWRQVRPAAAPGKRAAMPVIPVENLLGGKVTLGHGAKTATAQIAVQRRAIGTTLEEWSHLALCDNLRSAS
mgnify:CR=1 FL=1